jgi:hypothetical protein
MQSCIEIHLYSKIYDCEYKPEPKGRVGMKYNMNKEKPRKKHSPRSDIGKPRKSHKDSLLKKIADIVSPEQLELIKQL